MTSNRTQPNECVLTDGTSSPHIFVPLVLPCAGDDCPAGTAHIKQARSSGEFVFKTQRTCVCVCVCVSVCLCLCLSVNVCVCVKKPQSHGRIQIQLTLTHSHSSSHSCALGLPLRVLGLQEEKQETKAGWSVGDQCEAVWQEDGKRHGNASTCVVENVCTHTDTHTHTHTHARTWSHTSPIRSGSNGHRKLLPCQSCCV